MRATGVVDTAQGLVPFGHLCWAFDDGDDFRAAAGEYLLDGLALGQWVEYVGAGDCARLRQELVELGALAGATADLAQALDDDSAGVSPVGEFYRFAADSAAVVDPHASVAARAAATERAIGRGFTGFRAGCRS